MGENLNTEANCGILVSVIPTTTPIGNECFRYRSVVILYRSVVTLYRSVANSGSKNEVDLVNFKPSQAESKTLEKARLLSSSFFFFLLSFSPFSLILQNSNSLISQRI